jgi:hypothetical protein
MTSVQALAADIERCALMFVIDLFDDGVPPALCADALGWYIEQIRDWCDHDLPAQVRAWEWDTGQPAAPVAVVDQPFGLVEHRDDA